MKRLILATTLLIALNAAAKQPAPDRIRQYTYDAGGNVTQIDTEVYVYDSVDRVISGTVSDRVREYTYDAFGNRRKCKGIYQNAESDCQYTAQITSSTNHITGAVYDGPGNLHSYAGQSYTYDAVGSTASNGTVDYVYTADDERLAIIDGVQWEWTLRDGADKVLREVTSTAAADGTHSNWQWTRDNVFRNSTILSSVDPSGTRNYHTDHLGTPRVVSDTTGAIIGVHDYVPFGLEIVYDSGDLDHPSEPNPGRLKFTGHERDEDGLDYMHARYYQAKWGRFLSIDPVFDIERVMTSPQTWNRYAYSLNNPIVFTDPTGKTVFLVTYTTGNRHGDDEFKRAAETRAAEIAKQKGFNAKKDKVLVVGVRTKDDFVAAIQQANGLGKQFGKIGELSLYSHSGPLDGPIFHDAAGKATQFTESEVGALNINWAGASASANFYGCNTGLFFAPMFSAQQGVMTRGFDWYSSFSSNPSHYERIKPTGPVYMMSVAPRQLRNLGVTAAWPMGHSYPWVDWK